MKLVPNSQNSNYVLPEGVNPTKDFKGFKTHSNLRAKIQNFFAKLNLASKIVKYEDYNLSLKDIKTKTGMEIKNKDATDQKIEDAFNLIVTNKGPVKSETTTTPPATSPKDKKKAAEAASDFKAGLTDGNYTKTAQALKDLVDQQQVEIKDLQERVSQLEEIAKKLGQQGTAKETGSGGKGTAEETGGEGKGKAANDVF